MSGLPRKSLRSSVPLTFLSSRAAVGTSTTKISQKRGRKRARFLDEEGAWETPSAEELPRRGLPEAVFNICQMMERKCQKGDLIGSLCCGDSEYLMYGEGPGDRELLPLRTLLPCYREGELIPIAQRYGANFLSPSHTCLTTLTT